MIDIIEVWKDIAGYEGLYQVSNLGRVRSVDRVVSRKTAKGKLSKVPRKGIILSQHFGSRGYLHVGLSKGALLKTRPTHRLVLETFTPNSDKFLVANHISGVPTDNRLSNLEWCTQSENVLHALDLKLAKTVGVDMLNLHGEYIRSFDSVTDAGKFINRHCSGITKCARGDIDSCGGYKWRYSKEVIE